MPVSPALQLIVRDWEAAVNIIMVDTNANSIAYKQVQSSSRPSLPVIRLFQNALRCRAAPASLSLRLVPHCDSSPPTTSPPHLLQSARRSVLRGRRKLQQTLLPPPQPAGRATCCNTRSDIRLLMGGWQLHDDKIVQRKHRKRGASTDGRR
jgi:hypothetical protein